MKKKLLSLLVVLTLCLNINCFVFAQSEGFVIDLESVVSDDEALELLGQELYDAYGLAVVYMRSSNLEGMTGAEYAQTVFSRYVPYTDAVVLVDCAEATSYYMHYAGRANEVFKSGDGNAMMTAFDEAGTYDEGVRAYFNTANAILSQRIGARRELILLEEGDTSEAVIASAPQQSLEDAPLLSLTESQSDVQQAVDVSSIPENRQLPLVVDSVGAIDPSYVQQLNDKAESISEKYKCEVAVAFVNTTGGKSPQAFADDFYDYNGYGYGSGDDGMILMIAVQDRTFAVSTYGSAVYTFTDYGQQYMDEMYVPYLKNSDWAGAAGAYLDASAELLEYEVKNGMAYDISYEEPKNQLLGNVLVSLLTGFGFAFFPINSMKKKMHTVQKRKDAGNYMRQGSFNLHRRHDRYITSQVTRTPIPKNNDNNHGNRLGGGGGSNIHVSSSGRSHGGHSGSF